MNNYEKKTKFNIVAYVSEVRWRHPACEWLNVRTHSSEDEQSLSVCNTTIYSTPSFKKTSSLINLFNS